MSLNILFTCAGRRNYLINYFKEALKGKGEILAADQSILAPAMEDADIAIKLPNIYSSHYIDALIGKIKKHQITTIISLNDLELPILAKHKSRIEELGCKVIISSESVIDIAFDKWKTAQFIESIGLNSPQTYISLKSAKLEISNGKLNFPLVLKPRWGSASIAIDFADNLEELDLVYAYQIKKLKKSILNPASEHDYNHGILIQEKIEGKEYGMDILNDFDGDYVDSYSREKLKMRSGETDIAMSVITPNLSDIGQIIGKNLKHIGNLDCDIFKIKSKYYVLELNPRFGGGYPFSHKAGINIAAVYIDWLNGETSINKHLNYLPNQIFAKCDRLIPVFNKK